MSSDIRYLPLNIPWYDKLKKTKLNKWRKIYVIKTVSLPGFFNPKHCLLERDQSFFISINDVFQPLKTVKKKIDLSPGLGLKNRF